MSRQQNVTIRFANGIELVDIPLEKVKEIAEVLGMLAKLPAGPYMQVVRYPAPYPYQYPYWGPTWVSTTLTTGSTTRGTIDATGAYNNHGELK